MKKLKGFTLIELVIVIAILGILAGITIPRFIDTTEAARGAKLLGDMRTIESMALVYAADHGGQYPKVLNLKMVPKNLMIISWMAILCRRRGLFLFKAVTAIPIVMIYLIVNIIMAIIAKKGMVWIFHLLPVMANLFMNF